MRKLPLIISGLFFALPAAAQEAEPSNEPQDKVELKDETPAAKPEGPKPGTAPDTVPAPIATKADAPPPPVVKTTTLSTNTTVSGPAVVANDDSWKFEYHGYIRAPMRVGIGKRDNPGPGQSGTTYHSPVIPDDQYLSWQSSPHNKTDWAELYLSLGNSWAKGTVSIQGYNFADAAFSNPTTQLGISDGYIDLTPDLGYENFRLAWRVGAFSNKYGSAGKYDAGEYDTYMFGRIHNAGEALHIEYDIDEDNSLVFEHGIGFRKPDPSQFNNSRFTMLHHAHVTFKHSEAIQISAHYLNSWTQEEERSADPGVPLDGTTMLTAVPYTLTRPSATSITNVPDGKMWVAGLDARFDLGAFGYLYGAYSHVGLKDALTVARAIEVIHSSGGGEFGLGVVDNYLGPSCVDTQFFTDPTLHGHAYYPQPGIDSHGNRVGDNFDPLRPCSMGNGKVDTLLAQYEFSLTNFLQQSSGGQKFWGDGSDLVLKLYGMYNKVHSDYAPNDGIHKLKFGADVAYSILPWLTAAVRFDRLQPNSKIPEQSFGILSPRLVFKSKWNTHEAITLQYSRYIYNQRECAVGTPGDGVIYTAGQEKCVQPPSSPVPPDGFGANYAAQAGQRGAPTTRPDVNVFKIEATMWW
ncbi:MAG: hypothetical protein ABUL62_00650 [Myxococcales bacterium]